MRNVSRAMVGWMVVLQVVVATQMVIGVAPAFAERKKTAKVSASAPPSHGKANVCGCFKDPSGACFCGKKARCGCPGECEPRGCAEKHDKDIEREIRAETKRAHEMERKQKAAASKRKDATVDPSPDGAPRQRPKKSDSATAR
jgi:hypothetical protein